MTEDEFMRSLLDAIPGSTIGEDNEGQIIVYTGLRFVDGKVCEMEEYVDDQT